MVNVEATLLQQTTRTKELLAHKGVFIRINLAENSNSRDTGSGHCSRTQGTFIMYNLNIGYSCAVIGTKTYYAVYFDKKTAPLKAVHEIQDEKKIIIQNRKREGMDLVLSKYDIEQSMSTDAAELVCIQKTCLTSADLNHLRYHYCLSLFIKANNEDTRPQSVISCL